MQLQFDLEIKLRPSEVDPHTEGDFNFDELESKKQKRRKENERRNRRDQSTGEKEVNGDEATPVQN